MFGNLASWSVIESWALKPYCLFSIISSSISPRLGNRLIGLWFVAKFACFPGDLIVNIFNSIGEYCIFKLALIIFVSCSCALLERVLICDFLGSTFFYYLFYFGCRG